MDALNSLVIAFACFSAIPMPIVGWTKPNMRYMMAAFPLIGLVMGSCSWLWWLCCDTCDIGTFLRAAGLTLLPLIITGGIHMDGFADVVDAHSSHASPERKREILKDPHTGAFAIISISGYLIANLALATEVTVGLLPLVVCIPIVSRCLSAFMAVTWKGSSESGMFATVSSAANRRVVQSIVAVIFVVTVVVMLWHRPYAGIAATCVAMVLLAWIKRFSTREFGGMSGDLLGCFVQVCELGMLAAIVFVGRLG